MDTSRDLIEKVGGVRVVAEALGYDAKSVHNWTRRDRSIPARVWPEFVKLPAAKRNGITIEALARVERPTPAREVV